MAINAADSTTNSPNAMGTLEVARCLEYVQAVLAD
jgi:hypothetical protein